MDRITGCTEPDDELRRRIIDDKRAKGRPVLNGTMIAVGRDLDQMAAEEGLTRLVIAKVTDQG